MNRVVESFPRALAAANRVLLKNKNKDVTKPWADQDPKHHLRHASSHCEECFGWKLDVGEEELVDEQSGEHPAAHAIARLLMYLELLERKKTDVGKTLSDV